jgi:hypothetical protein
VLSLTLIRGRNEFVLETSDGPVVIRISDSGRRGAHEPKRCRLQFELPDSVRVGRRGVADSPVAERGSAL